MEQTVKAARTNIMGLHYGKNVSAERADFRKLPAVEGQVIVTNSPYGIRMGADEDLEPFASANLEKNFMIDKNSLFGSGIR